jgi:hypothetical protein
MNRDAVTQLVCEIASRFGDSNPQQLRQLQERLAKVSPAEAAVGLLQVFTRGEPAPRGSQTQELAGRLLATLEPIAPQDLKATIRAALPRYELSVEQFPQYLAKACGVQSVLATLSEFELEPLPPVEARALATMKFWLQGQQQSPSDEA